MPFVVRGRGNGALLGRRLVCEVNTRAKFVVQILQGRNLLELYTRRVLETKANEDGVEFAPVLPFRCELQLHLNSHTFLHTSVRISSRSGGGGSSGSGDGSGGNGGGSSRGSSRSRSRSRSSSSRGSRRSRSRSSSGGIRLQLCVVKLQQQHQQLLRQQKLRMRLVLQL